MCATGFVKFSGVMLLCYKFEAKFLSNFECFNLKVWLVF